jgi:hypothetical protein
MSFNYYVLKFRNISNTFKAFNIPKSKQNLLQFVYVSFPDVKTLNYYPYTDEIDITLFTNANDRYFVLRSRNSLQFNKPYTTSEGVDSVNYLYRMQEKFPIKIKKSRRVRSL